MTCPKCDQEVFGDRCACGWHVPKLSLPVTKPPHPVGTFITKEQFGLGLFETIHTISSLLHVKKMLQGCENDLTVMPNAPERRRWKLDATALRHQEQHLAGLVTEQMYHVSDPEQAQLLERYPTLPKL